MKRSRILVSITVASMLAAAVAEAGAAAPRKPSADSTNAVAESRPVDDLETAEATETGGAERAADLKSELSRVARADASSVAADTATYLIRLVDPAVPSYRGGEPGLAPTEPPPGEQLDPESAPARAYRGHLEAAQTEFIERMERTAGRSIEIPFTYQYAVNGVAAVLTVDEAIAIAADPSVASISPDQVRELHTDVGPQWQGAEALWNAALELGLPTDIKGEGIVIGTIDTGISPGNRSFADIGGDGYDHNNPLGAGNYLGVCNPASANHDPTFPCNDKLIGAYVFGNANDTAFDYDGHGSHTASTSGGNVVNDVVVEAPTLTTPPFDISGVAPHANVISYLGCCTLSGLTASINQAIADGVDVINYSIGSASPSAAWDDFDTVGFLNARAAGIFVATSNGNAGPGVATTGSPADAPWITSVGASTHNRHNGNVLMNLVSSAGPLADIPGKSVTGSLPSTPIVYAGAFGDPLCQTTTGNEANFTGRIVICDRGVNGRVEKSGNVAGQGAVGFVLTNDVPHGDSLLGDEYLLPGVFISHTNGLALKAWLGVGTDHQAAISGTTFTIDDTKGDIMASFSSRGPNGAMDVIVPSVTAPGVDVLAALGTESPTIDIHGFISGTSMASPHVAGAGALLTQARPGWSPAQQQSALMTTAHTAVLNHDGSAATPFAQGSGRINVSAAALAGLLFDETLADYLAANPDDGGDPKTLNVASFADSQCLVSCSWQREAAVPVNADAPVPGGVTWTASSTSDTGLTLDVTLTPATVSPGESMAIAVTAGVGGAPEGVTLFGRITLTPSDPSVPSVTLPVAVVPSSGVLPDSVEIETRRNAGSQVVTGIQSIGVTEFTGSMAGMVKATLTEGLLNQDPTRGDPYDDLSQVDVHLIEVAPGSSRLIAEVIAAEMPDLDMFVGTGTTPSPATEVCVSASGSALEHCEIDDPAAGTWWVLIQNWEGTTAQPDTYVLASAVVPSDDLGNAGVVGPSGPIPAGQPYDVRVHWDLPDAVAGDIWYGTAILGSSPATPGDIGTFPVRLHRAPDDVTKTASVGEAVGGDTVAYEIAVEPNVTDTDLVYTIVDTVPDGMTIDPASVTGGGVVDGQTITWEVTMPTAVGKVGTYVPSTPATDPQCAAASGFLDLATLGIPLAAGLDGDTTASTAFSAIGPFELYGEQFPNLVVAEDGLVTVTGGYGGAPWEAQAIPDPGFPNGVFAALWSDLELSLANNRGMRLAQSSASGVAVIQWDNPFEFGGDPTDLSNSVGKFQAWIYNSVDESRPEMTFEYGSVGALPAVATIGVESILGDHATAVVGAADPSGVVEPGGTICLDYQGLSFETVTLGYSVTVDIGALPGTYTNAAVHITDDPFAQPDTESVSVAVNRVCTKTITRTHFGKLTVSSGTTCINGALVVGKVTVKPGAGLIITNGNLIGSLTTSGAKEVTICGSGLIGGVSIAGSSAVRIGDPAAGCAGNAFLGSVKVTGTVGPTVIGGNLIIGPLSCSGNNPAPVNNGSPNIVFGRKSGQCAGL